MRSFFMLLAVLSLCAVGSAACASEDEAPGEAEEAAAAAPAAARLGRPAPAVPPGDGGARSVADRIEDASTAARIKKALAGERALRPFDFDPEVTGGRAVLFGDVQTLDQRARAAAVAREVEGVRAVENRLTVAGEPFAPEVEAQASAQAAPSAGRAAGAAYHTVEAGESLWLIAREHDTSVRRLQQLNGLRSNKVKPGDRLRVR